MMAFAPPRGRNRGFSLIEMMVALLILASLLVLTVPPYQRQILGARRALGRAALLEVVALQEGFFLDHKRYARSLVELRYPTNPGAIAADGRKVPGQSPDRVYQVELIARPGAYVVYARPRRAQLADTLCATLSLTSAGIKGVTGSATVAECW